MPCKPRAVPLDPLVAAAVVVAPQEVLAEAVVAGADLAWERLATKKVKPWWCWTRAW